MRPDGVDEKDKTADTKCLRLKMSDGCRRMPVDGVDEMDKMPDARGQRADEMESVEQMEIWEIR